MPAGARYEKQADFHGKRDACHINGGLLIDKKCGPARRTHSGVSSNLPREIFGGAVSVPPGLTHRSPPAAGAETGPPSGKRAQQRMFEDTAYSTSHKLQPSAGMNKSAASPSHGGRRPLM